MPDAEIEAMAEVTDALSKLDDEARGRVLRWAAERHNIVIGSGRGRGGKAGNGDGRREDDDFHDDDEHSVDQDGGGTKSFDHLAELYDAADPGTDAEKALVASYWAQVIKGKASFGSRELNKELKDLGHAVSAINKAMSSNMGKKPALILQVSRGGGSPQAQKKYKVSDAGKKWVEARLG